MAKPNYAFQKRQRELAKKQKKEAKKLKKEQTGPEDAQQPGEEMPADQQESQAPGTT